MNQRVFIVGNLMADVVVQLSGQINFGSDTPSAISTSMGGTGANVSTWLAHSGGNAFPVGVVGEDIWAKELIEQFDAFHIESRLRKTNQANTGLVVALVDEVGERTMFPDAGANRFLTSADLLDSDLATCNWLYLSAYVLFNEETREVGIDLATRARSAGLRVALDPASAAPLSQRDAATLATWLRLADLLLPNEDEEAVLQAVLPDPLTSYCPTVITKLGAAGIQVESDSKLTRMPAVKTEIVDTVGAGDAFAGGLLAGLSRAHSLEDSCQAGLNAAATAVSTRGAQPIRPTR